MRVEFILPNIFHFELYNDQKLIVTYNKTGDALFCIAYLKIESMSRNFGKEKNSSNLWIEF